jgi:hypothetical protein
VLRRRHRLPPARGVWRDDDRDGELVFDDTVIVFSYVAERDLSGEAGELVHEFLMRLGRETSQGEVGMFVDGVYYGFQNFDVAEGVIEGSPEVTDHG